MCKQAHGHGNLEGLVAGAIHDADEAALVVLLRVLDERDPVPVGRDPQEREITRTLVQHFADGIFDPVSFLNSV